MTTSFIAVPHLEHERGVALRLLPLSDAPCVRSVRRVLLEANALYVAWFGVAARNPYPHFTVQPRINARVVIASPSPFSRLLRIFALALICQRGKLASVLHRLQGLYGLTHRTKVLLDRF